MTNKPIRRCDPEGYDGLSAMMKEHPEGDWVSYEDHATAVAHANEQATYELDRIGHRNYLLRLRLAKQTSLLLEMNEYLSRRGDGEAIHTGSKFHQAIEQVLAPSLPESLTACKAVDEQTKLLRGLLNASRAENAILSEKLAERDALLRSIATAQNEESWWAPSSTGPDHWECPACYQCSRAVYLNGRIVGGGKNQIVHSQDCWLSKVDALLSASAEPIEMKISVGKSENGKLQFSAEPVICPICKGSEVVSTTDKDHEGNNFEIRCPACDNGDGHE